MSDIANDAVNLKLSDEIFTPLYFIVKIFLVSSNRVNTGSPIASEATASLFHLFIIFRD